MLSKKSTSMFLAILLLVSNLGLAFNVHYCEGRIASVSSVYNVEEVCAKDVSEEATHLPKQKECCAKAEKDHKSCCKDKTVDLQDDNEIVIKTFSLALHSQFVVQEWEPMAFMPFVQTVTSEIAAYYCDSNAPPLFKLYKKYILYA